MDNVLRERRVANNGAKGSIRRKYQTNKISDRTKGFDKAALRICRIICRYAFILPGRLFPLTLLARKIQRRNTRRSYKPKIDSSVLRRGQLSFNYRVE